MKFIWFRLFVVCFLFSTALAYSFSPFQFWHPSPKQRRPNIILVVGDDIGYNDVGWHNPNIHTPFLNQLAKEGVVLENYYTYSLCTPSRASILTGYYAERLGLQRGVIMTQEPYGVPLRYRMLPRRLKEAGYSTHALGKWHVGYCDWQYTPTMRGFDSFLGFYNGAEENYFHCLSRRFVLSKDNCTGLDFRDNMEIGYEYKGRYSTELYTERAVKIIHSHHNKNKPLFMYVALTDTHFPLQPPKRFLDRCNRNTSEARRRFCGAMASIDESVSNITAALKAKGLYENSIIIFVSDNGGATRFGASNYPLRGEKGTLWEGGTRVPAFVHSPLLKKRGYVNHRLIHASDWYPTLTCLAGLSNEYGIDGINQWDTINANANTQRTFLPYHVDKLRNGSQIIAIRDSRYKLIAGPTGDSSRVVPENETVDYSFNSTYFSTFVDNSIPFDLTDVRSKLYDLQEDPFETNNLASSMPKKLRQMWNSMMEFQQRSKPAVKIPDDPAGDPEKFNYVYSPGWCRPYYDVPDTATDYTDHFYRHAY